MGRRKGGDAARSRKEPTPAVMLVERSSETGTVSLNDGHVTVRVTCTANESAEAITKRLMRALKRARA
jgi:hypothetical protein